MTLAIARIAVHRTLTTDGARGLFKQRYRWSATAAIQINIELVDFGTGAIASSHYVYDGDFFLHSDYYYQYTADETTSAAIHQEIRGAIAEIDSDGWNTDPLIKAWTLTRGWKDGLTRQLVHVIVYTPSSYNSFDRTTTPAHEATPGSSLEYFGETTIRRR